MTTNEINHENATHMVVAVEETENHYFDNKTAAMKCAKSLKGIVGVWSLGKYINTPSGPIRMRCLVASFGRDNLFREKDPR